MAVAFFIVIDGCGLTGHRVLVLDEADDVLRDKEEKRTLNKAMPTRKAVISRVGCSARLFFFFFRAVGNQSSNDWWFLLCSCSYTQKGGKKKHACLLLFDFSFPTHSLLFHSFCILHKGKQRRQFTNHNKKKGSTIVHGTEPVIKGGSCETLFKLVNCLLFSPSTLSSKPNSKTGTDRYTCARLEVFSRVSTLQKRLVLWWRGRDGNAGLSFTGLPL